MAYFHSVEKYKKKMNNLVKLIGGSIQYDCMPKNTYDLDTTANIHENRRGEMLLTTTDNRT